MVLIKYYTTDTKLLKKIDQSYIRDDFVSINKNRMIFKLIYPDYSNLIQFLEILFTYNTIYLS